MSEPTGGSDPPAIDPPDQQNASMNIGEKTYNLNDIQTGPVGVDAQVSASVQPQSTGMEIVQVDAAGGDAHVSASTQPQPVDANVLIVDDNLLNKGEGRFPDNRHCKESQLQSTPIKDIVPVHVGNKSQSPTSSSSLSPHEISASPTNPTSHVI